MGLGWAGSTQGWAEIASRYHDPASVEAGRISLANAVLSFATDEGRNVEVLKRAALEVMARSYTSLPWRHSPRDRPLAQVSPIRVLAWWLRGHLL
jgi:hypothetical protein